MRLIVAALFLAIAASSALAANPGQVVKPVDPSVGPVGGALPTSARTVGCLDSTALFAACFTPNAPGYVIATVSGLTQSFAIGSPFDGTTPGPGNVRQVTPVGLSVPAALPSLAATDIFTLFGTNEGGLLTTPAPTAQAWAGLATQGSASAETYHVFKASAGNLYNVAVTNLSSTASGYVAVLNLSAQPATNAAISPTWCPPLQPGGLAGVNFDGAPPDPYSAGITVVVTQSCYTYSPGTLTAHFSGRVK